MCNPTTYKLALAAVGDLRDALNAMQRGQAPAAIAALMAIDAESWAAIESRLSAVGLDVRSLLDDAADGPSVRLPLH